MNAEDSICSMKYQSKVLCGYGATIRIPFASAFSASLMVMPSIVLWKGISEIAFPDSYNRADII